MIIRSRKRTLFWFAFTTAPLLGLAIEPGQDSAIVLALIALFGLQAFAAEFLGLQSRPRWDFLATSGVPALLVPGAMGSKNSA